MVPKLIITVDTEADNQWQDDAPLTVENLKFVARFQSLCEKFNFLPVYLMTYEVAENLEFTSWLRTKCESGLADFGAHLHPWSNPPFSKEGEKQQKTFPCDLPLEVFEIKLKNLTELIAKNLGSKPVVFRAGRWGINDGMMPILAKLGYKIDSSITPLLDWSQLIKGASKQMDFRRRSLFPQKIGEVLEIPMTIMPVPRFGFGLGPKWHKIFYQKIWGRIFPKTKVADLIQCFQTAERLNLPYFQLMVHSSELMSGGSIYNKRPDQVEEFYSKLEKFFIYLADRLVEPQALSAIDKTEITTNQ